MVLSSNRTAVGEMVMPCTQETLALISNDTKNTRKLSGTEAVTVRHSDLRLQPDLRVLAAAHHVNMGRLARRALVR